MDSPEVKKSSKKSTSFVLLHIVEYLTRNSNPQPLIGTLDISKQNLQYYINICKRKGYIRKIKYKHWEVQKKGQEFIQTHTPLLPLEQGKDPAKEFLKSVRDGIEKAKKGDYSDIPKENDFSIGTSDTNLHALQIKMAILEGKIKDSNWTIKEKLKNWIPKYKTLGELGGLTIKNNNNKSITVFAKSRDIQSLEAVDNLAFKIRLFVGDFFRKQDVILDIYDAEVKNIHLETEDQNIKPAVRRKEQFTLDLKKPAEKIFEKDNIKAKAWIDPTPKPFTVGTNDKEWKRAYLSMPYGVQRLESAIVTLLNPAIENLAENMNTHVGVMKEIKEGIKEFRDTVASPLARLKSRINTPEDVIGLKAEIESLSAQDKEELSGYIIGRLSKTYI